MTSELTENVCCQTGAADGKFKLLEASGRVLSQSKSTCEGTRPIDPLSDAKYIEIIANVPKYPPADYQYYLTLSVPH